MQKYFTSIFKHFTHKIDYVDIMYVHKKNKYQMKYEENAECREVRKNWKGIFMPSKARV